MADTFDKVRDGQPLEIAAATWNALLEAGEDHSRRKVPGGGGPALDGPLNPAVRVLVKNATGAALAVGSVVALGTPVVSPADYRREAAATPLFPGTVPAATTDAFAVLAEPLGIEEIGRAVLMGVASCNVNVVGATDTYATPKASDSTQLDSAATGPARILWREAGSSGTKKALVLLEGYSPPAASDSPYKTPVRFRTTANVNLAGGGLAAGTVHDGVTAAAGDRALVPAQSSSAENGIYVVPSSGAAARAADADTGDKVYGATVFVSEGAIWKDTVFICTTNHTAASPIVVGTTSLTFAQTPAADIASGVAVSGYVVPAAQSWVGPKTVYALPDAKSSSASIVDINPAATDATVTVTGPVRTSGNRTAKVKTLSGAYVGFSSDAISELYSQGAESGLTLQAPPASPANDAEGRIELRSNYGGTTTFTMGYNSSSVTYSQYGGVGLDPINGLQIRLTDADAATVPPTGGSSALRYDAGLTSYRSNQFDTTPQVGYWSFGYGARQDIGNEVRVGRLVAPYILLATDYYGSLSADLKIQVREIEVGSGNATYWTGQTGTSGAGDQVKHGLITAFGTTGITITSLADSAAANNTLYYSTTGSKLAFKDPGGTVHYLY